MKDLNRLKVVLAEKKRTNKWLAEQLGKNYSTISKWCTNTSQPDLQTLDRIAQLLDMDVKDLLNSTRDDVMYIPVPKQQIPLTRSKRSSIPALRSWELSSPCIRNGQI